jgi:formate dehydrogenase major subunit
MNMDLSRRAFLGGAGAGLAGTALGAFGFADAEAAYAAAIKPFRLTQTKEARSTCPYCAVSCGMMVFSAESAQDAGKLEVVHIEGDSDNPVNRGTLCPKGAAAIDYIKSDVRVKSPMYRKPGANGFEEVTWDFAMERIAQLMKEDRDANFVETNGDGVTVNRWPTMGFLSGSSCTNETGWITWKVTRGLGVLQLENQARI